MAFFSNVLSFNISSSGKISGVVRGLKQTVIKNKYIKSAKNALVAWVSGVFGVFCGKNQTSVYLPFMV
jgi:hypothetical protein